MTPKRLSRLLVCAILTGLSGCGLVYDNQYRAQSFTIYSDRSDSFVSRVGRDVEQIYGGYQSLFGVGPRDLGRTTIILEGDGTEVDEEDEDGGSNVLGYYVPLLNFISVDTTRRWARSEVMLQQVLLHEVAHHFIVTEHPAASRQCWLNEGLAGTLEVTLFETHHFEYPLFNMPLFLLAQRAVHEKSDLRLNEFVQMDWHDFHGSGEKETHYALAWSIVYFILEQHLPQDQSLGERFNTLYRMADRADLASLEDEWIHFLRSFDVAGHLLELASRQEQRDRLTARWAVVQLGASRNTDTLRILSGLMELFDDSDDKKRLLSYFAFLKTLERNPHSYFLGHAHVREGLRQIHDYLDDPAELAALSETLGQVVASSAPEASTGTTDAPFTTRLRGLPVWNARTALPAPASSQTPPR